MRVARTLTVAAALALYVLVLALALRHALDSAGAAREPVVTPPAPRTPSPTPAPSSKKPATRAPAVVWRDSVALGLPWRGRLERGVVLPREGRHFFTWDPVQRSSPNRAWRRVGHDRLVRVLLRVAAEFRRANRTAPRLAIGDLSRSRGGDFGPRYGVPGHVSHQNGLDADVYYPRVDRRERPPDRPRQIDQRLAQDLVERFVRAGAVRVFVGPRTRLRGNRRVVQVLAHHDDHLHVRITG